MSTRKVSNAFNVLSELPETLLSELFDEATVYDRREGEVIFRAGDVGDGCYRIQKGLVKIAVTSHQGEERIISLLGPNAIVGELSMIDGRPRSASVVAIVDCSLSFVSRARFLNYSEAHPEIMNYLVRILARRLRDSDDALAAATFLSVKARLARALLHLAQHTGQDNGSGQVQLCHKVSQSDLAAMAGVARENVSRTLGEWRKRDIVTLSSEYYCINDPKALAHDMEMGS
jgi:CRP-like cAMP-binding protein